MLSATARGGAMLASCVVDPSCRISVAAAAGSDGGSNAATGSSVITGTIAATLLGAALFGAAGLTVSAAGNSGAGGCSTMRVTMATGLAKGCFSGGALSARTSACSASDSVAAYARPRSAFAVMQGAPDFLGAQRHLQVQHAQRIEHRVHHRRHRADGSQLAAAFHAKQIGLARHTLVEAGLERRQVVGARHGVIHQRAGKQLPAVGVQRGLVERRAGP